MWFKNYSWLLSIYEIEKQNNIGKAEISETERTRLKSQFATNVKEEISLSTLRLKQ